MQICNQRNNSTQQYDKFECDRKLLEMQQELEKCVRELNEYKHDSILWKARSEDLEQNLQNH